MQDRQERQRSICLTTPAVGGWPPSSIRRGVSPRRRAVRRADLIADLDPQATDLEGYLFPDTYAFSRGTSEAQIVATLVLQRREHALGGHDGHVVEPRLGRKRVAPVGGARHHGVDGQVYHEDVRTAR